MLNYTETVVFQMLVSVRAFFQARFFGSAVPVGSAARFHRF